MLVAIPEAPETCSSSTSSATTISSAADGNNRAHPTSLSNGLISYIKTGGSNHPGSHSANIASSHSTLQGELRRSCKF